MKNVLSYIGASAAALFLFGVLPIQAQETAKANIPFSFHTKKVDYESGTYTVKTGTNNAPMVLISAEGRATFEPTSSRLNETDKTLARGPALIFKCGDGTCYLSEVWTDNKGYSISHRETVNEEAYSTRIVALVRAAR
jgi:hypothetical protein